MADLFISYAKADRLLATELADELRASGFSVWIDQSGIKGAKNWSAEIVEGINACSTLIVLLSPDSIASHNVAKEVQLASEKRKNILPVVIEKVALPANFEYSLVGLQRVYYHDRPAIISALEMLNRAVTTTEQWQPMPTPAPVDTSIRVAVLPFDDLSPKHDNQWFADGMMDELISTLRQLDRVKVPSRSDVMHYRDHRVKSRDIARELGVRYLIEGAVRKADKRIRINASLIDTQKTEQLWANTFDGSFDNIFDFQESVAKKITDVLKIELTPEEKEIIATPPTENAEAYELYLRGREQQYLLTKEGYLAALGMYEKAAALDPEFADAHIAIGSVCNVYYREYSRDPKWLRRAEESAARAEEITGETAKTLWIRGEIKRLMGETQEAISILTKATALDPKYRNPFNILGTLHMVNGNYSEAADAFQRVVDLEESTMGYFNLLVALNALGEKELLIPIATQAIPVFERYMNLNSHDKTAMVSNAYILLWAGEREKSLQLANQLTTLDLGGNALYNLGNLYDELGKPEFYNTFLRKAIEKGYREIEQTRNYAFTTKNSECERELKEIIAELEGIIAQEAQMADA